MKRFIYFLSLLVGIVILFPSCDTDMEGALYDTPATFTNGATFQSATGSLAINPGGTGKIAIPVYRLNPSGSFTTNVTADFGGATAFSAPATSVTFDEGKTVSEFVINYDYNTMKFNTNYSISLTLGSDAYAYIPGYIFKDSLGVEKTLAAEKKLITNTILAITKNLTWTYLGKVYWKSEWWEEEGERDIWRADQLESYRVQNIFFIDNGKFFEFTVAADKTITAVESQEIWYYASYAAWVCAQQISGAKDGNTFNILVGRYYMPGVGGWAGPWKETGTLMQ